MLRGAFGSVLKRLDADAYRQFFTPTSRSFPVSLAGDASPSGLPARLPSGLNDLPRPFVFRVRESEIGVHLFLASAVDLVCRVMADLDLELAAQPEPLHLSLVTPAGARAIQSAQRLRVRFLTPTELKGTDTPEFGPLMARIRDRISTLRALYGPGPLDIDFRSFGEHARAVRMTYYEWQPVHEERISKHTGQRHAIGGFTGFAEYEGPVAEFIPYLEAARWTGVGRQTVWGKGEISAEIIYA